MTVDGEDEAGVARDRDKAEPVTVVAADEQASKSELLDLALTVYLV